jgi:hypothetical protein
MKNKVGTITVFIPTPDGGRRAHVAVVRLGETRVYYLTNQHQVSNYSKLLSAALAMGFVLDDVLNTDFGGYLYYRRPTNVD